MKPILLPLLLLLLLHPLPSHSHNGAVAIAVPVEGIVVDGDLSDWPEGMREYPIERCEYGDAPKDSLDFQGSFRIGFNEKENVLFLGVEMDDDSIVIDTTTVNDSPWDLSDGCDVYFSIPNQEGKVSVSQYALWGNYKYSLDPGVNAVMKRMPNHHTYEWRIDIGKKSQGKVHLQKGMSLGVEVVLGDRDADGSFSWMAWGSGTAKANSPDRVGFAFLSKDHAMGTLEGRIKWEDMEEGVKLGKIRIQSLEIEGLWVELQTNQQGYYEVELPVGKYRIGAVYRHQRKGREVVEVQENHTVRVEEIFCPILPFGKEIGIGTSRTVVAGAGYRHGFWQILGESDGLVENNVTSLLEDRSGQIWIGTSGGLSRYDGERFVTYTAEDGLANNHVISLLEDHSGQIWIGTSGGLSRYDGERFVTYTTEDGLVENNVISLLEDHSGQIWIGTSGGLSRYDGERFVTYTSRDGLASSYVTSLLEDRSGQLWVGTGGGVSWYDGERFVTYTTEDGLANNHVMSLLEDQSGQIWIGSWGGGVSRYGEERFVTYATVGGLVGNFVESLLEDRSGQIWIGTSGGLSRYDGKRFVTYTSRDGLASSYVTSLLEDRSRYSQELWMSLERIQNY
jgi:hypothetical protein